MQALIDANKDVAADQEFILDIDMISSAYRLWLQFEPFEYDIACNLAIKNIKSA